jgi:CAI-1 autoinducer synthase
VQAQIDALKIATHQVVQSGVFHHGEHPSRQLERALGQWLGFEDSVLCQSGYMANVGLIQAIANAQTPVYIDMMAHMSLWEGIHAAKATAYPFRHNDPANLAKQIERHGAGLVIVDSVYSTTGALCPLTEIVEVCEKTGCMILVDESHSLGTHGSQGKGLCAALGLSDRVHFITASLAKAFSSRAGIFTLPRIYPQDTFALRCMFSSSSHPHVFSSSLLGYELAGLAVTLKVIQGSNWARERLAKTTARVRRHLTAMGYPIAAGSEQIIALEAGLEPLTLALRDALEKEGVFGAVFCAPATSRNRSMVRLTLNAGLTDSELDYFEQVCEKILPEVKPWTWPIAQKSAKANDAATALNQYGAGSLCAALVGDSHGHEPRDSDIAIGA